MRTPKISWKPQRKKSENHLSKRKSSRQSLSGMEVSLVNTMSREKVLKQYLDTVKSNYDFILLDCMPSLGMLTVNALAVADNVLIPVQAAYLSAKGLEQLLQTINKVRRNINPKLKIEGVLLTMVDSRTNYSKDISNLIRENYGGKLKVYTELLRIKLWIPFQRIFPDGICRVTDSYYTKTIQFQNINCQLAQQDDKTAIGKAKLRFDKATNASRFPL